MDGHTARAPLIGSRDRLLAGATECYMQAFRKVRIPLQGICLSIESILDP